MVEPTETETRETLDALRRGDRVDPRRGRGGPRDRQAGALHDAGPPPRRGRRRTASRSSASRWAEPYDSARSIAGSAPGRRAPSSGRSAGAAAAAVDQDLLKLQSGSPSSAASATKSGLTGSSTTLVFENIGKLTPKLASQNSAISSSERGSWPTTSSAGKPRMHESLLPLAVELLQALELRRVAALGGGVDHQDHLAAVAARSSCSPLSRAGCREDAAVQPCSGGVGLG